MPSVHVTRNSYCTHSLNLSQLKIVLFRTSLTFLSETTMLASVSRRRALSKARFLFARAKSTSVDQSNSPINSPIADDGRHENWREGIYDHDNEPK
jgi:hypothetical protein